MLRIVVQRDGQVIHDRTFDEPLVSVGRGTDNHLVLDAPNVSSLHLVIKRSAGRAFLLLDQSTNGTRVAGEPVDSLSFEQPIVASVPPFELTILPSIKSGTDEAAAVVAPTVEARVEEVNVVRRGRGGDVELRALSSDGTERTIVFAESALIGRTSDCDMQLTGRDVSRRHALISRIGEQFQLRRLSEVNPVSINDRSLDLNEAVALQDGDLVRIASHELLFFSPATRPAEPDEARRAQSASPNFDLHVEGRRTTDPSIAAFDLIGFLGEKTAARVTPKILPALDAISRVIIDLGYLIGADEAGIHALASIVNEADRRGVAVQIIRVQPRVGDILSQSPLEKILRRFIARSEESAVRRLRQ